MIIVTWWRCSRPRVLLLACTVVVAAASLEPIPARSDARAAAPRLGMDSGHASMIVYQVLTGGLWTVQPDGKGHRPMISRGNDPAWAPDGSRLLYTAGSLFSTRPDGSGQRLIIDPAHLRGRAGYVYGISSPAWAPNGRRVAFVGEGEDADERSTSEIFTASATGSRVRRLRSGRDPAWSADGRRLYFTLGPRGRDSYSNRIATMRRDGTGVRVLIDTLGYRRDLEVSPDGSKLAYLQSSLIHVLNLRTGNLRMIPLSKSGFVEAIAWTPGGSRIAYIQNTSTPSPIRAAPSPIVTIRPDGTGRRQEFVLPYDDYYGTWATELAWQPKAG